MKQYGAPHSPSLSSMQDWHDLPEPKIVVPLDYTSLEPLKVSLDDVVMHGIGNRTWIASRGNQSKYPHWSLDDAGFHCSATCDDMSPQYSLFGYGKSRETFESQKGQRWLRAPGLEPQHHLEVPRPENTQTLVSPAGTPADHNVGVLRDTDAAVVQTTSFVSSGYTVPQLVRLAGRGNQASVLELLEQGEDPNIKDAIGMTALHAAAKKGYEEIVNQLLCRRAHVNAQATGWQSESPLHYASKYGHTEVAQRLLANRADPNLLSKDGRSALHYAQEKKQKKIVHMLMQEMT